MTTGGGVITKTRDLIAIIGWRMSLTSEGDLQPPSPATAYMSQGSQARGRPLGGGGDSCPTSKQCHITPQQAGW
jgi:hypothetical protein